MGYACASLLYRGNAELPEGLLMSYELCSSGQITLALYALRAFDRCTRLYLGIGPTTTAAIFILDR